MFQQDRESQINSLLEMSARIGGDPLLVQAGTGNTSIKLGGTLWIKASGKWLAHARDDDFLVPMDLAEALICLQQNIDIIVEYISPSGKRLKPSVETAMHSIIPQRVVIHVHSVNTIAWAVRREGLMPLRDLLAGLRWAWIPYVPSGNRLAREIEKAIVQSPGARVFILANHGLVVCGESCESAESLLDAVEKRLAIRPRPAPASNPVQLARFAQGSQWRLPDSGDFHALGTDAVSRDILSHGILYPCQAIFFGSNVPATYRVSGFDAGHGFPEERTPSHLFALVENAGILVSRAMTFTERAMLAGLVQIVQRIDGSPAVAYLTPRDVRCVLNADAYRYRALMENEPVETSP